MHSRFVVYCGPMFSSKTTRLLSELDRFRIRRKDFLCFKPRIDDRGYKLCTHGAQHSSAYPPQQSVDQRPVMLFRSPDAPAQSLLDTFVLLLLPACATEG